MNRAVFRLLLAFALAACGVGCAADEAPAPAPGNARLGGQTGGEAGLRCTPTMSSEPLAFDTPSPLGFSGADVARALPGASSSVVLWRDGTDTTLDVTLTPGTRAGYASSCRANVLDVTVSLRTADGALDETVVTELFAKNPDAVSLDVSLALDELD
ncbi:MAG TPA: hypothetical protein VGQ57_20485, partial [Polyangiaceae bacterium]|nr:hypothetical protein [Polyangiaceae bacterium]